MKIKYYSFVLIILMGLSSCNEYLDTTPTDFLNPRNYYETEDQINFAKNSVYDILGQARFHGIGNYLMAWTADEAFMNRTSLTTGPWNYFYNPSDRYTLYLWTALYDGINRANVLLANVDNNPDIDKEFRDVVRGEMLFLRGFYHFYLVTYFGGIPVKTEPTSSVNNVDQSRNTIEEVYAQIIADMEAAEPLVKGIKDVVSPGVVNKSAVRGMLARVNLQMAGEPLKDETRYQEARNWAKKVMDDSEVGHELNPSYPQVFINLAQDKYDVKESLFEAEIWSNNTTGQYEAGNSGYINGVSAAAIHGRGVAYLTTTSKLYDAFEEGDNRFWWSIAHFTYSTGSSAVKGEKNMVNVTTNQRTKNTKQPAKYRREYETLEPQATNATPINYTFLRYADVLLIFAEAENEINSGPTPAAIEAVNKVRQRAWSTGVKTITITNNGSGYTTAPTVTFSTGTGTNIGSVTATATATISEGQVTAITLNRDLTGVTYYDEGQYSSPPAITISGGGGTGATAVATIYDKSEGNVKPEFTASKESFLAFLQDERMRELNLEYKRKADLLRWGIFLQVNQEMANRLAVEYPGSPFIKYYSNVTERDLFMPIPTNELITNQKMVQNPMW
ncbi:RagB/SusD family nutrient uptake outer membrane protein [Mariniphaga sediminis]|uniref:RagB/SusD family nutrient uptake outer membrane protein n=1 Tax=Mariniphaga sediminis TaxID=1628158 RepID=A0A399D1T9_9BACT|nr:RagB/SusD family nutrient uptake outer membrane protein [Mariniphaga sediminis]RIH65547.1 RagB/SusD family nutrient uptake outer membrane protein [Mariniphaga sediminis]